jgi:phosphoribosylaminoimidazolecarboxamide formyltransferase/IMP cyclohydrolase
MKTALLASYEKDDALLRLGRLLTENGWTLLGSAGTAKYLNENKVSCRDVAEIVGPPILGHRVVTLSRELHAGLLAATPADFEELQKLNIAAIDLVYVTLYPLEKTIADPLATPADVIEKTDIGGPTLLRAAAKGRRLALSDPSQIDDIELFVKNGEPEHEREALTTRLVAAAERRVADYVGTSARYWESML